MVACCAVKHCEAGSREWTPLLDGTSSDQIILWHSITVQYAACIPQAT